MQKERILKYGQYPLTKFKPERVAKILDSISKGVPYKIAAEANGIADATFYDWMAKGSRDLREDIVSDYAQMVEAIREIEQKRIIKNQQNIEESPDGHEGAKWVLERVFWKYFSSKAIELEVNERLEKLEREKGDSSDESKADLQSDSERLHSEGEGET